MPGPEHLDEHLVMTVWFCLQVVHLVFQYLKMLQNLGPQQRSDSQSAGRFWSKLMNRTAQTVHLVPRGGNGS